MPSCLAGSCCWADGPLTCLIASGYSCWDFCCSRWLPWPEGWHPRRWLSWRPELALRTTTVPAGPERNRALGVYGSVSGLGFAAGVILGGVLTSVLSWRWVFFVNVPVGLLVLLSAFLLPPSS